MENGANTILCTMVQYMVLILERMEANVTTMVLILDVNSEMGAHVRSNLCYFIC